jgi:hypothetical protein
MERWRQPGTLMLSFKETMDPNNVDVMRNNLLVARLQWHPERRPKTPRIVALGFTEFTIDEMREMIAELERRTAGSC